jgi:hypothetical protein
MSRAIPLLTTSHSHAAFYHFRFATSMSLTTAHLCKSSSSTISLLDNIQSILTLVSQAMIVTIFILLVHGPSMTFMSA